MTIVKVMPSPEAIDVPFDNSGNGFTSDNVQDAIEESALFQGGKRRFPVTLLSNGTQSNNEWITYSELLPDVVVLFPIDCVLKELTWANRRDDVDFDLEFYKNGTNTANRFWTYEIRNGDEFGYTTGLNFSFSAGDWIRIKYRDRGKNTSDMALVLWMEST